MDIDHEEIGFCERLTRCGSRSAWRNQDCRSQGWDVPSASGRVLTQDWPEAWISTAIEPNMVDGHEGTRGQRLSGKLLLVTLVSLFPIWVNEVFWLASILHVAIHTRDVSSESG